MSRAKDRDEMLTYLQEWSPAEEAKSTTNGILVEVDQYHHTDIVDALFGTHGWVIDQIHWETNSFHIVPEEVLTDE